VYEFQISIHSPPQDIEFGAPIELRGRTLQPLTISHDTTSTRLTVTFEQAEQSLSALSRLFFEPDGSFVWVGATNGERWQVDGELYDGGVTLAYAELRGDCSAEAFDQLLTAFGWPDRKLMFQLVREAVFLNETAFRQYAESGGRGEGESGKVEE